MNQLERAPSAVVANLIRRPAKEVFAAFVEPQLLTRFWLAHASAPLAMGAKVRWQFLVKGASAELHVTGFEVNERIVTHWDDGTTTQWEFIERGSEGTLVTITQAGFRGSGDEQVSAALDATGGYTLVLSDLKVLLERGESPHLVKDKALLIEQSHEAG